MIVDFKITSTKRDKHALAGVCKMGINGNYVLIAFFSNTGASLMGLEK